MQVFGRNRIRDDSVRSQKTHFPVIPAKAGIQCFEIVMPPLDPGFHRGNELVEHYRDIFF